MSEIEDLRRDAIELRDWKAAVLDKCKASDGWNDLHWGGDKEGWGFVHFFIGHLETRALMAPPSDPTPAMIDAALKAWFKSPPSETDQGLERSMKAALIAALAVTNGDRGSAA